MLGLRGPVLDGHAVIVELRTAHGTTLTAERVGLHVLDLGGLGIRDLCFAADGSVLLIAGPAGAADGPFRLHRLALPPVPSPQIQTTSRLCEWPATGEHPEGLCPLAHHERTGLIVVYDTPSEARIAGGIYQADWLGLP